MAVTKINLNVNTLKLEVNDFDKSEIEALKAKLAHRYDVFSSTPPYCVSEFDGEPIWDEKTWKEHQEKNIPHLVSSEVEAIDSHVYEQYFKRFNTGISGDTVTIENIPQRKYPLKCLIKLIQQLPKESGLRKLVLSHEDYMRLFDVKHNPNKDHKGLYEAFTIALKTSSITQVVLRDLNGCALLGRSWDPFVTGIEITNENFGLQNLLTMCQFLSKHPSVTHLRIGLPIKIHKTSFYSTKMHCYQDFQSEIVVDAMEIFGNNGLPVFVKALAKTSIDDLVVVNVGIGKLHPEQVREFFSDLRKLKITHLQLINCKLGECPELPEFMMALHESPLKHLRLVNNRLEHLQCGQGRMLILGKALSKLESLEIVDPHFAGACLNDSQKSELLCTFVESLKSEHLRNLSLKIFGQKINGKERYSLRGLDLSFWAKRDGFYVPNEPCRNRHKDWNDQIVELFRIISSFPNLSSFKVPELEMMCDESPVIIFDEFGKKVENENKRKHEVISTLFNFVSQSTIKELVLWKSLYEVDKTTEDGIMARMIANNKFLKVGMWCYPYVIESKKDAEESTLFASLNKRYQNSGIECRLSVMMGLHPKLGQDSPLMLCKTSSVPMRGRDLLPILFQFTAGFIPQKEEPKPEDQLELYEYEAEASDAPKPSSPPA